MVSSMGKLRKAMHWLCLSLKLLYACSYAGLAGLADNSLATVHLRSTHASKLETTTNGKIAVVWPIHWG